MDAERKIAQMEEALLTGGIAVGTSRQPQFGDWLRGIWASQNNPIRDGRYVKTVRRTGRLNHGTFYELTDGHGKFWRFTASETVFIEPPTH
jgi:hypothetical protein